MSDEKKVGIGTIKNVTAKTIIGMVEGDVVVQGGESISPVEVLRRHVVNLPPPDREEFQNLVDQLELSKPDKPLIDRILGRLSNVLGRFAVCAEAIEKIKKVVDSF